MKLRFTKALAALAVGLSMCVPATPAQAFIASIKGAGMGQTGVANPLDAEAAAYNPAGMVWVGDRVDVGLTTIHTNQKINIHGNGGGADGHYNASAKHWYFNPHLAANKMFCCDTMSLGFTLYNKEGTNASYKRVIPIVGQTKTHLDFVQECLAITWAWKFLPCHSLGVSLNIIGSDLRVKGIQNFESISISPNHVSNKGHDTEWGVGVTIGYLGHITDCFRVGVAYTPEISLSKYEKYRGFLNHHGKFNSPEVFKAGLAYDLPCCVTVAFDATYEGTHQLAALGRDFAIPESEETLLGQADGPGFGWNNRWFFRTGVEWRASECLSLRAGYRYAAVPFGHHSTAPNLLTMEVAKHYATCGATYYWGCYEFSAYYAHGFYNNFKGSDSIPIQLGGGEVDLKQSKDAFGLGIGYNF